MTHNTHTHTLRGVSLLRYMLSGKRMAEAQSYGTRCLNYTCEKQLAARHMEWRTLRDGSLAHMWSVTEWTSTVKKNRNKQKKMREEKICVNQVNQKKLAKTVKEEKHHVPSSHHLSMIGNWLLWLVALSPLTTHHPLSENPYDYWRSPRPMLKKSLINFYHKIEYWHEGNSA